MKQITKIPKFRRFVIQNFPFIEQDFDALTDYALICKIVEFLNKVITSQNSLADEVESFESDITNRFNALQNLFNILKDYVDHYFDNLDVQEEINNKLDKMVEDGTMSELIEHYFNVSKDIITLGDNLLENASWTLGTGWSGDFSNGFIHVSGSTETLTTTIDISEGELYVLKFNCSNQFADQTNNILAQFGGSPAFDQYYNDGNVTKYLSFYPENGELVLTPASNWTGVITNIGIYKIETSEKIDQALKVYDTDDNISFAITVTKTDLNNTIIGKGAMQYATAGSHNNVAVGNNVLERTASGYYNTAVGSFALQNSIQGTRNVAVGFNALNGITYGDRNIGVGSFALHKVTSGKNNIGIGADSAWHTTTGSNNIAMSNGSLNANTTGSGNIALGYFANSGNTTANQNISIGHMTNGYMQTGNGNIAIGYMAHYKGTGDGQDIAIGYQAMLDHAESGNFNHNVAIGYQAFQKNIGSENVVIGTGSLKGASNTTNYNVAIGSDVMSQTVTSSGQNVAIGHSCGRNMAGTGNVAIGVGSLNGACGNNNVAIGYNSLASNTGANNIGIGLYSGQNVTSGEKNIFIGHNTGNYVTTAKNVILIGTSIDGINSDNYIQIGSAIKGIGSQIGLAGASQGSNCAVNLPIGTETTAPLRLNSGTLLSTPGNGCIEFDGSHLYITINNVRKSII